MRRSFSRFISPKFFLGGLFGKMLFINGNGEQDEQPITFETIAELQDSVFQDRLLIQRYKAELAHQVEINDALRKALGARPTPHYPREVR